MRRWFPIGLDLVAKLLSRLAELGVPGDLRLGALDYELGAIGGVVLNQLLFLADLDRQSRDKPFLLELHGDTFGDVGDRAQLRARAPA